jgi:hypothetical protein
MPSIARKGRSFYDSTIWYLCFYANAQMSRKGEEVEKTYINNVKRRALSGGFQFLL